MILRIRGVKRVRAKGRLYYYHRATMTRLPGAPGSLEFTAKLEALSRSNNAPKGSTLGSLFTAYRASPEFDQLADSTKFKYRKVFDALRSQDRMPLVQIEHSYLYGLRDRFMAARKRAFTNLTLAVLSATFNWGMRRGHVKTNPVTAIEKIARPRNARVVNRPWRPEELEVVLDAAPVWLRVPIALAAYTGLRESDVLRVTWSCYDGSAFETRTQKTNMPVWVPAHYRLREILDTTSRVSTNIVVGARGRPISRSALTTSFFNLLRELRETGRTGPGLSFHGLRHTLGTALAEAGCDPPTIASVLGQATTQMAEHYSRYANRRHHAAAAIERIEARDRKTERKTTL